MLSLHTVTYISWVFLAIKTSAIWVIIVLVVNFIFYRNKISGFVWKNRKQNKEEVILCKNQKALKQ